MRTLAVGAVALLSTLSAAPAYAQAQTFDGPYVGVQAGLGHDEVRSTPYEAAGKVDDDRDSFSGGAFAGYNLRVTPSVVLGVEGSFDVGADDAVRSVRNSIAYSIDPRFSFDLGASAGYLVDDKTLLYVRGGYKNVQATTRRTAATASADDHRTLDGWTVGGGVERYVTDNVSARIEYRYSDLGKDGDKFDRHQGLVGVAYHF